MPPARSHARKAPDERKRQLVESAIEVLAEGGLAAFTVERIARHAGISKGLITHYFEGKEDLLAHAYEAMVSDFDLLAETYFERIDARPRPALEAYIEAYFRRPAFEQERLRAWLAVWEATAGNSRLTEIHRRRHQTFQVHLTRLIAAAAEESNRELDAAATALMLDTMLTGLWIEWCLNGKTFPADTAISTAKAFLARSLGELD